MSPSPPLSAKGNWPVSGTGKPPSVCVKSYNFYRISCIQVRKNSLNIKFLGGIFLGHPGPRRRDIPDKNFMQMAFFYCFRQGVAGMSRDLGRDVPDWEKLYARKLWAAFSYPMYESTVFPHRAIGGARWHEMVDLNSVYV